MSGETTETSGARCLSVWWVEVCCPVCGAAWKNREVEGVSVELLDGTGMTPLMHASWKGHAAVAK